MKRSGLGRGLDALLTSTEPGNEAIGVSVSAARAAGVHEVPTGAIQPNPYQPRQAIDPAALEELVASVRVHGLIQPLIVTEADGGYRLIAGERRWRAAQAAGLERVPVVVRTASEKEMLALAIIENVQRADLDAIEAAQAYRKLMDSFSLTQQEVAELVGKSRTAIANTVRLLNLAPEVRTLVAEGHLSEGHGRALLGIDDLEAQRATARRAIAGAWTVRQTEEEVRRMGQRDKPQSRSPDADDTAKGSRGVSRSGSVDPDTAAALRELEGILGTKVELRRQGEVGQLVIHFYSQEELSALYELLASGAK